MSRYLSEQVAGWHEQERQTPAYRRAEVAGFSFDYYATEFADAPCDNLVTVLQSEDPNDGIEPIIKVSSAIPEQLQVYFALHEYVEFHASQLEGSTLPTDCWQIERFVISKIPGQMAVSEFIERRLDMFAFLEQNELITPAMQHTVEYLKDHQRMMQVAAERRSEARRLRALATAAMTEAYEIEQALRGGTLTTERHEDNTHDRQVAGLLYRLMIADSREDRRDLEQEIAHLTGEEGPTARQQQLAEDMYSKHYVTPRHS